MRNVRFRNPIHLAWIATIAVFILFASAAQAQYTYQLDGWTPSESNYFVGAFSPQDILIANSFTVVPGAQKLTSIKFLAGFNFGQPLDQVVTAAIYTGSSLTDPQAGSGLQRIVTSTNTVTVAIQGLGSGHPFVPEIATIPLASPVTLPVGQVFYAGLLLHNVGFDEFPYAYDQNVVGPSPPYLGRSFEGFGNPTYNLDDYSDLAATGQANIVLRVNGVPEPGLLSLMAGIGVTGFGLLIRRRQRN